MPDLQHVHLFPRGAWNDRRINHTLEYLVLVECSWLFCSPYLYLYFDRALSQIIIWSDFFCISSLFVDLFGQCGCVSVCDKEKWPTKLSTNVNEDLTVRLYSVCVPTSFDFLCPTNDYSTDVPLAYVRLVIICSLQILAGLRTDKAFLGRSVAQCVANVALCELVRGEWQDLIDRLENMISSPGAENVLKQSCLEAIGYICEEIVW